ncbi:nucleic acid binding protein [Striga asiatica]|uniref:Nucleic acid binding protein n=1 Tax=Striga asiatica TaxID=4170 RepID=A0A5A7QH64_STRAF|nr:nucleic acid binding protein [Striga asiatica]
MGKNQAYKAMQRARLGSSSAAPEEVEDGMPTCSASSHGGASLNFLRVANCDKEREGSECASLSIKRIFLNYLEWHAARLASLKTSHTVTWEEFKKKQKLNTIGTGVLEASGELLLAGWVELWESRDDFRLVAVVGYKDKDAKKHSSKKRKVREIIDLDMSMSSVLTVGMSSSSFDEKLRTMRSRRSSDASSSSSSETSSSDTDDERESKRSKSRSKRSKKGKKHRSRSKHLNSEDEEADGPLPLSRFFGSIKR